MTGSTAQPTSEPVAALTIQGLSHVYGDRRALRSIDLQVSTGCLHGLVGPNGAGKSTLLKILGTLMKNQSGLVHVLGMSTLEDALEIRKRVGYLSEDPVVYHQMSCFEMLDFCGAVHGLSPAGRVDSIGAALETVGLAGRRDHVVGTLSRGQQRRVGVARTLIHDPDVLILDEPAAGLDPRARSELTDLMCALRDRGKTVVISSHVLADLGGLCDGITILDRGRVRFHGPIDGLPDGDGDLACFELRLQHEDEAIREIIMAHGGVLDVLPLESAAACRVVLRTAEADISGLLAKLVDRGVVVLSFVRERSRLNEAFLSLTTRGVD
ncbi:MAG TPA: ABC transporter ATP-binding protein [Planctomycetaceae bacterium]|nr:ABC transporter ATP-binding protein [Planctomycetaceae bacterium]